MEDKKMFLRELCIMKAFPEFLLEHRRDLLREINDHHTRIFQDGPLSLRRAVSRGNDRAGVSHPLARRGHAPGDEPDHGFGGLLFYIFRRDLLVLATDLPDHHDAFGLVIAHEHLKHVDKTRPDNRVAAQPHAGGLPDTVVGKAVNDFISQRPAAGNNSDGAGFMDMAGHDANLGFTRRDDPGTIRPDKTDARPFKHTHHFYHIEHGDALGNTDD